MATSYSVTHHGQVPSTQDLARDAFNGRPVLVTAAEQTAGRGRGGSTWLSAPRSIAVSLAFRPGWAPSDLTIVPLIGGLAATEAMEDVELKWPNDVIRHGAKVAGLLAELFDGIVVIGMGVNLWWPDAPSGTAALFDEDPGEGEGRRLAERWADALTTLVDDGPGSWPIDRYRARCATLGTEITWDPDGAGLAVDVARDGSLVVDTDTGRINLTTAGVRHVRPQRPNAT